MGQVGLGEMAGNASTVSLMDLVLAQGSKEASRSPALRISPGADLLPEPLDGRQTQGGEQDWHHREE